MTSVDFNFAEPIASFDDSMDHDRMDTSPVDIGSLHETNYVVLERRPTKIVEVHHSQPGKHGHTKVRLIGIDIFTGRRYEGVAPVGHMISVPKVTKKEYLVVNIEDGKYTSLLDENKCQLNESITLNAEDNAVHQRLIDKFNSGQGQIKVTVLKAMGEEQIMAFKVVE